MTDIVNLPRQNSAVTESGQPMSREWYNFFRRLTESISGLSNSVTTISNNTNNSSTLINIGSIEKTIVDPTTARTLSSGDANSLIEFTNSASITVTVTADSLKTDDVVYLKQSNTGQVTVVAGAGVTIETSDSLKTRTQESTVGLKQTGVNEWTLFGDIEPVAPAKSALIRAPNSIGAPAWSSPTADGQKLKQSSGALAWSTDTAADIVNVPAGNIAATDVQTALNELDTEKAALASPAFTGNPTAPTQAVGNSSTRLATTAFVNAEIANDAPTKTGGGASGTWGIGITGNAATVTNGVYTTGNQTVAGVKTFSNNINLDSSLVFNAITSCYMAADIGIGNPGLNWDANDFMDYDRTNNEFRFAIGVTTKLAIRTNDVVPGTDNTQNFGSASLGWKEIFADNGTINTSDARRKTAVSPFTPDEINASKQLSAEIGVFKFLSAISEKGNGARKHIGMTVQRAIQIMQANNLDPFAYGFICFDAWDESTRQNLETGETEIVPSGDKYSFRVHELLLFIARGVEARLTALENA